MKSIMETDKNKCYICGSNKQLEDHHIFYGTADRKKSEKMGLKVHLCAMHHRDTRLGVHGQNHELNISLKQQGQRAFEKNHSRKEFMRLFGKNYLDN